jgi:hypothetical protein
MRFAEQNIGIAERDFFVAIKIIGRFKLLNKQKSRFVLEGQRKAPESLWLLNKIIQMLDFSTYTKKQERLEFNSLIYRYNDCTQERMRDNYNKFKFHLDGITNCPYCNQKLSQIHYSTYTILSSNNESFYIGLCKICGYWAAEYDFSLEGAREQTYSCQKYQSILKEFNLEDKTIPIEILSSEIKKKPNEIYHINPYKMEELVQYVFSSYYNCEVHHCGRSSDGGIDLFVILSDQPTIVQVKRRSKNVKTEPINLIRELIGTLYINNCKNGIYVTTANNFSKQTYQMRNELLSDKRLDYFELIISTHPI